MISPVEYGFVDLTITPGAESYAQVVAEMMQSKTLEGYGFLQLVPVHDKFVMIVARVQNPNLNVGMVERSTPKEEVINGDEPLIPFTP